ncbi:lipoprotein-anchoring transpeptidase ErfK/SrfK [Streptomyces canus]|uniref:Lipoprotein-anchoring transpeptidase ErfK/SrfK n=2 Tax=Streptomyces canus TaxID=58343 RepID=A0AAW8FBK7_9ACTN|nr:lipoprotein-anchoring transpeptidase ErfK/SrfK [Streptomyces canus]MDQ0907506.1 lipoprotein-anchoring transpeptidase ErfK/SrfK [Streptomyces canus]MDQ1067513.1 lipoprotein-anchoring transpeptidase ErfK/SrfK [Streptomyces canus]
MTWAGLLAGVAGCTADGGGGIGGVGGFGKPPAPEDVIRVAPDDGTKGVPPEERLRVRVPSGRLESVTVVKSQDAQDFPVPGRISEDGLRWEPDEAQLALAAKYTVDAVALDGHGRRSARHTTFTTYVPEERFIGYVSPENRSTVGTGMIVSLEFNREIEHRAAVERAVRVTSKPAVEIRPHWFGNGRLDFRPEHYWRPGTRVTVALRLRDVEGASGVYGLQYRTFAFTVGRSQVSLVDAARHTMQVRRDGELIATVPITAGAPKTTTYNGKMVVTEMLEVTRMNSRTVGFGGEYDIPDVPHALRLTDSGTFLHGNYWAPSAPGRVNVSHGCVGLRDVKGGSSDTPAGWFFDRSLVGDVVEVVHSNDKKVAPDNGLGGWNMGWKEWKAGSAVK